MHLGTWLVLAATVLSALGCGAGPSVAPVPARRAIARTVGYLCPDQSGFQASITPDGASVTLEGLAPGPVTLPIAPSASGARYTDGTTTFWSKGAAATLERPAEASRTCVAVADPAALPGTRWRLGRIESMSGTAVVPADPSNYTLEFGADGAVSGRADCNRFRGRWTASGTSMSLGPLAMTRAMCPAGSLSDRYARSLESAVSWRRGGDGLAIAMRADAGILHFERMP
jgi:heat shock protein HslJ